IASSHHEGASAMRNHVRVCISAALIVGTWSCTTSSAPQAASATAVAASPAAEDVAATITQLEKDWVAASEKKDAAALDRLLAAEFVGTSPTAHTYTKAKAVSDLKDGIYDVEQMTMDEVSVNVFGTTAISFTSQQERSKYAGTNTSGHYHFTDVW